MRARLSLAFLLVVSLVPSTVPAQVAQSREKPASPVREILRQKMNENSLTLMCGALGAAYIQLGQDIAVVVNDGDNIRVLPVVSDGAFTNVRDVLFLKGVDLGISTVQILNELRSSGEYGPNIDRLLTYIAPLSVDTLHILARPGINTIWDLKGKKVSFNTKGSGTARFTPQVFRTLGIPVEETTMTQGDAIEAMSKGELDATACSCPMPPPLFSSIKPERGFKFLDVPYVPEFERDYVPGFITNENYPNLVSKDKKIETLATSTILISFNWPRNTDRYRRTEKFVEAFFTKFDELRKPPRHPAWRDVNMFATIRGWQRFPAAQEWIDRAARNAPEHNVTIAAPALVKEEDQELFREFLKSRQQNH